MISEQCAESVWGRGEWHPHKCGRQVKADGLCGLHLTAAKRRAESEKKSSAELRQFRYVWTWHEKHPDMIYGSPWTCPLCYRAIQGLRGQSPDAEIDAHQQSHGDDWPSYLDAGKIQ